MSTDLTLGAEEELHLIDLQSRKLVARAPQILARLPEASYSAEIQRSTVETNTDVVDSLAGLRAELLRLRRGIVEVAAPDQIGIAAAGSAPSSAFADFELTTTGRYGRMQEQYRLLVDEQLICGLQIHVGVPDRDLAVEIMQRIARDLPILLALSASSPFWNEQDSGYASMRSMVWQRWPTAGATGPLGSAAEYDEMIADLIRTGVIADSKMAYFDVRPSAHAPTLELRTCDACPLVDDAILIAGLFRATVLAARQSIEAGEPFDPVPAAGPPGRALARRPQRAGRRAARRRPSPRTVARGRRGRPAGQPAPAAAERAGRLGRGQRARLEARSRGATRPTGSARRTRNGAGCTTWSTWWSARPTVGPVDRSPPYRPCGTTATGPATRRSGPASVPGRSTATWSASSASYRARTWRSARRPRPVGGRRRAGLRGRAARCAGSPST